MEGKERKINEDIDNSGYQKPSRKGTESSFDTWERQKFKSQSLSSFLKTKDGQDIAGPHFPPRSYFSLLGALTQWREGLGNHGHRCRWRCAELVASTREDVSALRCLFLSLCRLPSQSNLNLTVQCLPDYPSQEFPYLGSPSCPVAQPLSDPELSHCS